MGTQVVQFTAAKERQANGGCGNYERRSTAQWSREADGQGRCRRLWFRTAPLTLLDLFLQKPGGGGGSRGGETKRRSFGWDWLRVSSTSQKGSEGNSSVSHSGQKKDGTRTKKWIAWCWLTGWRSQWRLQTQSLHKKILLELLDFFS